MGATSGASRSGTNSSSPHRGGPLVERSMKYCHFLTSSSATLSSARSPSRWVIRSDCFAGSAERRKIVAAQISHQRPREEVCAGRLSGCELERRPSSPRRPVATVLSTPSFPMPTGAFVSMSKRGASPPVTRSCSNLGSRAWSVVIRTHALCRFVDGSAYSNWRFSSPTFSAGSPRRKADPGS